MIEASTNQAMPSVQMAEKAALSCIMQNPKQFLGRSVAEGIDSEAFWARREFHNQLTGYLRENPECEEVDTIGFVTWMQLAGTLDRVGGPSEVAEMSGYAVSVAGWTEWGNQLREAKARRLAIIGSNRLSEAADSDEAIQTAKDTLSALTGAIAGKLRAITAKAAASDFIDRYEASHQAGDIPGASSGIGEIDAVSGGLRAGEFWVIGGKPSRGKSVLMLQIASAFIERGETVAVFSLEMMGHEVIGRLVSVLGRVDYGTITQPRTAVKGDMIRIKRGVEKLTESNLWIDASAGQTLESIQTESERIRDVSGSLSLVVVDYLQLIRGNRGKGESREEEIARVSGGLKQLSKRLNCPVLSATQLNEAGQTRESRAIEQDADALLFIVDDGIKVGKLRNGQRNDTLPLFLNGAGQIFDRNRSNANNEH